MGFGENIKELLEIEDYACGMSVWICQSLILKRWDFLALYMCCSNPVCQYC